MNVKISFLSTLHLFLHFAASDKYPYANFYEIAKLNNFDLNPKNPIDAFRILKKNENQVHPVNFLGALYGIWQISETYGFSIIDLLNLKGPGKSNNTQTFTQKELKMFEMVKSLSNSTADPNCQNILQYAETYDQKLKCKLDLKDFNFYKIEYLHLNKPKIILVHDFDSSQERKQWLEKIENLETFHMKSLYIDGLGKTTKVLT